MDFIVKKKFYKKREDIRIGDVLFKDCNYEVHWNGNGNFDEFYISVISYIRVHNPGYLISFGMLISHNSSYDVFSIVNSRSFSKIFPDEITCHYWFLTEVINDELRKLIIGKILDEKHPIYNFNSWEWDYIKKSASPIGDDEETFAAKYKKVKDIISATQQYYVQIVGYPIDNIITYTLENLHSFVDVYTFKKDMIIYPYKLVDMYYIKNTKKSKRFLQQNHPLFSNNIYSIPTYHNHDSSAPALTDLSPLPSAPPL